MTDKFKQLLEYQRVDYESEKVEREILNCEERREAFAQKRRFEALAENRKKLIAHLEKMKQDLSDCEARCEELLSQAAICQNNIKDDYESSDELEAHFRQLKSVSDRATEISEKIRSITASAQKANKMLTEQTLEANAARDRYQVCKQLYDERLSRQRPAIEEAKTRREEAAKGVDPVLLHKYTVLRENKKVPTAELKGSTCTGCNMMLPSAIVSKVAGETEIVECENCARLLYIK